jgi:hypothetical protein
MPVLPLHTARFVGDPVALVLAESRVAAEDAAECVAVDWAPLPAIADIDQAKAAAALVDTEVPGNRVSHQAFATPGLDAAFARADRIVETRFDQHRQTHVPLEPRGVLAIWDAGREQRRRPNEDAAAAADETRSLRAAHAEAQAQAFREMEQTRVMGLELMQARVQNAELKAEIRNRDAALQAKDAVIQGKEANLQVSAVALQSKDALAQAMHLSAIQEAFPAINIL